MEDVETTPSFTKRNIANATAAVVHLTSYDGCSIEVFGSSIQGGIREETSADVTLKVTQFLVQQIQSL